MSAACKIVPRLFHSFPYLIHVIYLTSRRQYVTANPTYTSIFLTSTDNTYRHIYSHFFLTPILNPFRGRGKLYTNPHGGTYTMAPSEGVVRVRRHILITFHCAILQHYTPAALLLSPILFNIIHSCRHLVLAYRQHLVFEFGGYQSPRRYIPLHYLTTTYAQDVSTTFRDSFCRGYTNPILPFRLTYPNLRF